MEMELYLYADVLFLVNFTMDFLSLYIAASLTRRRVRTLPLTLASGVGALYGVASCFMGGTLLFRIIINIAVAFVMCFIAFKGKILSAVAVFYTCGCMLGGIMTALFSFADGTSLTTSMLDRGKSNTFGDIPLGWAAVVAIAAALAAIAGGRIIKKRASAFDVTVTVVSDTGCYVFDGICDSGNLLTDPFGGQAVIILEKQAFLSTLKASDRAFFEGFERFPEVFPLRIIPSDTVNGHGLLYGYLPRRVSVNGAEKNAVVAMGDGTFDGRKALVPSTLCER